MALKSPGPINRVGALFADLYELTMAAGYYAHAQTGEATFSLFVRNLPAGRNFLVAAGLEQALDELEAFSFLAAEIEYLKKSGLFTDPFLDYLKTFRFSGSVYALAEGTLFYPDEPLLEITAPIIEAQILETFLINTVGFATLIASKAARCIHAAQGRTLIDFSMRRTQGSGAGLAVARSTYITGFAATSNVLAGKTYGIPTAGTMAHSFVSAFESEEAAFRAYAKTFPHNTVLLIDTYDTLQGARTAVHIAKEMQAQGAALVGVRLDSGDMLDLSRQVRRILDEAGFTDVKIFASSSFDELKIAEAVSKKAPIDAFGVGTLVGVSSDAPFVDIVYKLIRYQGRNIRKLSTGKENLAGLKQVYRRSDPDGKDSSDEIGLRDEKIEGGRPLLTQVMQNGHRPEPSPSLETIQTRFKENFAALPEKQKSLYEENRFPVHISPKLAALQKSAS